MRQTGVERAASALDAIHREGRMLETSFDGGDHVVVTFRLPLETGARGAFVVGEFNDWSTTAAPMRLEGGHLVARLSVPAGRTYRFRYLLDDGRWENDWAADDYVRNEFGGEDSLIDLRRRDGSAAT